MPLDPRTPVLVGVAAISQREEDPDRAREPLSLMAAALERAAEDAGSPALLARADSIRSARGFWNYADPCRWLAERFGASGARTEMAEIGVLQTTPIGRAAADIAAGRSNVVLVAGGEARHRASRARAQGKEARITRQLEGLVPDSVLCPAADIYSAIEMAHGLVMPVSQYALLENALRAADGQDMGAHAREVAELQAGMSRVAANNPDAWSREPVSAEEIREPVGHNRMLATPYTKLHVSQWNVDQAAGLILCSVATADALGVPRERRVYPLGVAESNHMLPLTNRRDLHRAPGFGLGSQRVLAAAALTLEDVAHFELYSCFPSAVRVQQREIGVSADRAVTVTGGMTFAGGPLNSFVFQSIVRMAQVLREEPGSAGIVTAVSGIVTKQGVTLWSTEPGRGFAFEDVSEETAARTPKVEVVEEGRGDAVVATATALADGGKLSKAVLVCDLDDGHRAIVTAEDVELAESIAREEFCGRALRLEPGGRFSWR